MANWKFWWSIWPWPNFSRSSQICQMIHSDIISHCYQSQVCIFNGCWDITNWKIWRSIWPWPACSRSSQIWQIMHNDVISYWGLKRGGSHVRITLNSEASVLTTLNSEASVLITLNSEASVRITLNSEASVRITLNSEASVLITTKSNSYKELILHLCKHIKAWH